MSSRSDLEDVMILARRPNIAFIGKMGTGKSTAANFLTEEFGYRHRSLAMKLKVAASALWKEPTRDQLQRLGLAVRDIDENALVNAVDFDAGGPVVIDDCRFPNEYWALKERGFVFIRVETDRVVRIDRLMKNGRLQHLDQLEHESETAIDDLPHDHWVHNDMRVAFKDDIAAIVAAEEARR